MRTVRTVRPAAIHTLMWEGTLIEEQHALQILKFLKKKANNLEKLLKNFELNQRTKSSDCSNFVSEFKDFKASLTNPDQTPPEN
jgi:hypothetical protein